MTAARYCESKGYLVDGDTRLPSDPSEYYRNAVGAMVGCNRLRCPLCDVSVRSGPPGLGLKSGVEVDPVALYSTQDWSSLPFVEKRRPSRSSRKARVYSCKCRYWEAERAAAIDNEHDSWSDPDLPWACVGHPVPDLPVTLGELTVGPEATCADLVEKILHGACPRSLELATEQREEGPSLWLGWLYCYLAGCPLAEQLSAAVAERIDDPDPQVVGRVLNFFSRFPGAEGIERLVSLAEAAPHRVAVGYPIQECESALTLWDVLIARLELSHNDGLERSDGTVDQRVATLLRTVLLIPLASLSHEDLGPTSTTEFNRLSTARFGGDLTDPGVQLILKGFEEYKLRERTDVVVNALGRFSTAFNDDDLRLFIANRIVELNEVAPGRWRAYMDLLSDWYHKPAEGHLIIVAGMGLLESHAVAVDEFRDWMKTRSSHGWIDPAWVMPLETVLDQQSHKPLN